MDGNAISNAINSPRRAAAVMPESTLGPFAVSAAVLCRAFHGELAVRSGLFDRDLMRRALPHFRPNVASFGAGLKPVRAEYCGLVRIHRQTGAGLHQENKWFSAFVRGARETGTGDICALTIAAGMRQ